MAVLSKCLFNHRLGLLIFGAVDEFFRLDLKSFNITVYATFQTGFDNLIGSLRGRGWSFTTGPGPA